MKEKALVLYSGGLDSRLVVKLLQEQGFEVEALHFSLPFGCGCCNLLCNFGFTQRNEIKMTIFDCNKGDLLKEYLDILKHPKHGVGKGINPCKDCKIFMFKKAKEYADKKKISVIATGEVTGQRPMSQTKKAMKIIDDEIGFEIKRPLVELGINGRQRVKQMELAKKYDIRYPNPGGGCLLCEKSLKKRFKVLFDNDLINEKTLLLSMIGRHFFIDGNWFVVARDEKESLIVEKFKNSIKSDKGKPAVYFSDDEKKAIELQKAYQEKKPEKFKEFKL
jgi:predicted subunit of tRNA(5-methylaminomethyl-2-thiouridylate) methyltransferase